MKGQLDKVAIVSYLNSRLQTAYREYIKVRSKSLTKLGSSLVETINAELPKRCPSVEGFKYVVHATVQVSYILAYN